MSRQDPGTATGQPVTDWNRWRKCWVCHARIGEPCLSLTDVPRDQPHSVRKLRTGMAS